MAAVREELYFRQWRGTWMTCAIEDKSLIEEPKFNSCAETYNDLHRKGTDIAGEDPDFFAAYKITFLERHLRKCGIRPTDILDFGCGVGNCLSHLVPTFPTSTIHGLDVSGASVEIAKRNFPSIVAGVIGDVLPLPDHSVDVAMAAGVFHHIPPMERQKWMNELHRVVRPGGRFYLFEHNPLNPVTQKIVRDCPFDDDAILLSRRESVSLMREAGFSDVSTDYVMFFPHALGALRPLERFFTKIPMGAQYVTHGRA